MIAESLSGLVPSGHIRTMDISKDLDPIADLIEMSFPIEHDRDGQEYIREMRRAARDMRMAGWFSTLAELGSQKASGFVWEENGQIVGNLSLIPFRQNGTHFHMIANVAVHPDYRRHGIARALTEQAMHYLRRKKDTFVWLQVRDDNPAAYELYRSVGFKEKITRTTWRIQPFMLLGGEMLSESQVKIRRRKRGDWAAQKRWLRAAYPRLMQWNLPVRFQRFEPGVIQGLGNLLDGAFHRHWVIEQEGHLQGVITWQKTRSFANNIWLAFPQEVEAAVLGQALFLTLRRVSRKHPLSIDCPKGWCEDVFSELGFKHFRTLIWMRCDL